MHLTRNRNALGRISTSIERTILVWIYTCLLVQSLIYIEQGLSTAKGSCIKQGTDGFGWKGPKSKDCQTQKEVAPLNVWSITSVVTKWPQFMKLTEIMETHLTHARPLGFLHTCHVSGIFWKVFHLDNGTFFPGKASMIKPPKYAGPGYALPFSRHAVGKTYPCLSCTTEAKHPGAVYQQEVFRC